MPPFPHHDAQPSVIRDHAATAQGKGDAYIALSGSLFGRANTAATEVDGYIDVPVATVTGTPGGSSRQLSQAAYLAAGCLNRYASAIDVYNTGIDGLNQRWWNAKAAGFYVGEPDCSVDDVPGNRSKDCRAATADARHALKAQLRHERDLLLEDLDTEADAIGTILDTGPTDEQIMLLIAAGYLPASAADAFPSIDLNTLNTIRSYFHEARKLWHTPGRIHKLFMMLSATKNLNEVAAELARTQHQWGAVLGAIERTLDTKSLASLNTYFKAQEDISFLSHLRGLSGVSATAATTSWINAAKATGKIGGPLAGLSLVAHAVSLGDLIMNGDGNASGFDTTLRVTGDIAGLVSSGGGLLAAAGVISLGPVGAGILIGAGLVSAGVMIYRNWDDISNFFTNTVPDALGTAADWTGDRLEDLGNLAGDVTSDVGDWAGDVASDVGDWAGGVASDVGDAWDAVTPW